MTLPEGKALYQGEMQQPSPIPNNQMGSKASSFKTSSLKRVVATQSKSQMNFNQGGKQKKKLNKNGIQKMQEMSNKY